jgi:hypothetical protein
LSPALQQELQEVQKRMAIELQPLVLESTLTMQKMLETEDHEARCNLLKYFIDAEKRRLSTKRSLQGLFSSGGGDSVSDASMPREEMILEDDKLSKSEKKPNSIFLDDEDAFQ